VSAYQRPVCCVRQCRELATATVHVQWTVVDWDNFPSCAEHLEYVFSRMARKTVDGLLPAEMWTSSQLDLLR
jgi:hypothetical protein